MSDDNDLCLYVFVNTTLESMNPGKAQAHAGHAANAFVYKWFIKNEDNDPENFDIKVNVARWMSSTKQGFGTQINLKCDDWTDLNDVEKFADEYGYPHEFVVDPTYPFEVTNELFDFLQPHYKKDAIQKRGKWVCFRKEETAFYIFGQRSDKKLANALKRFPLHP